MYLIWSPLVRIQTKLSSLSIVLLLHHSKLLIKVKFQLSSTRRILESFNAQFKWSLSAVDRKLKALWRSIVQPSGASMKLRWDIHMKEFNGRSICLLPPYHHRNVRPSLQKQCCRLKHRYLITHEYYAFQIISLYLLIKINVTLYVTKYWSGIYVCDDWWPNLLPLF